MLLWADSVVLSGMQQRKMENVAEGREDREQKEECYLEERRTWKGMGVCSHQLRETQHTQVALATSPGLRSTSSKGLLQCNAGVSPASIFSAEKLTVKEEERDCILLGRRK